MLTRADAALESDLAASGQRHPQLRRLYHGAVHHRLLVLGLLASIRGIIDGLGFMYTQDLAYFAAAGGKLLSGHWANAFVDPRVQIGPIQLLWFALESGLAKILGISSKLPVTITANVVITLGVVFVARALLRDRARPSAPQLELFIGLVACLGGLGWAAATSGHPTEGFIPLLWVLAAREARAGRVERSGIVIGLSAGLKLWGGLGAPLLLFHPSVRRVLRGWLAAAITVVGLYGPFFVWGKVNMLHFEWHVKPQSPLTLFLGWGSEFTWQMRLVESAFLLCACAVAALVLRRSLVGVWAAPLAVVAARFLVDPLNYHYYWLSVGTIALVGAATLLPAGPSWRRVPVAVAFYVTVFPWFVLVGAAAASYIAFVSISMIAAAFTLGRRHPAPA
jgi:hypothetical protein